MPEYRWLGLSAPYGPNEINIIATLPVREQAFLHTLKAFTEGELEECPVGVTGSPDSETRAVDLTPGHGTPGDNKSQPLYTDPEDIPFGAGAQTPRKRPVYALCWTWRKHRMVKTKQRATRSMRVWKKWYERQGWKVSSHATGYFARHPSGQSHSISLHEYDAVTKERLR